MKHLNAFASASYNVETDSLTEAYMKASQMVSLSDIEGCDWDMVNPGEIQDENGRIVGIEDLDIE